jgi:two-component system sensor histidine kinase AtoS
MIKQLRFPSMAMLSRRQPSLADLEALLDLLPQPAFLWDQLAGQFLLANARATELTAFTRAELTEINPEVLFQPASPDVSGQHPLGSSLAYLPLRQGGTIEVIATLIGLDPQKSWCLVTLEPVSASQQIRAEQQRQAVRLEELAHLAASALAPSTAKAIQEALAAGHRLTGAGLLAVYLARPNQPSLERTYTSGIQVGDGEAEVFPQQLPADEVPSLLQTAPWAPGKRAATSLQRAARAAHLAYLASVPLGSVEALIGVLVSADPGGLLHEDHLSLLRVVAATITGLIEQESLRSNLAERENDALRLASFNSAVWEANQDGILVLTRELGVSDLNPAAEEILGYASREVSDQPVGDVLIGPDNLIPALQAALQGISTPNLGNVRLHRRDGTAFPAYIRILPLTVGEQLEGVIVLLRDLSEHEQVQVRNQQLEQRALLGEITAIFAHEVRNPINNISTGLQVLALNLPEDDPNQDLINRLNQDCNRLTHLMQSVLSFSRPAESRPEPVELAILIPALVDRWRPRLARLNVRHEIKISARHTTILGDLRNLEQVFNNLIGNAVEAMSASGGNLSIQIRSGPTIGSLQQVEVNIIDDGPGIPEDTRIRIFEPFFTTNRNGTGLGLAIAKRIVTAHKGNIQVSSVPGGTVFQVQFPLIQVDD